MGTRAMTMDLSVMPDWLVSMTTGMGGIGVAFLGLRKYLRSDSVDRATSESKTTTIDMLTAQLEKSDLRIDRLMRSIDERDARMAERDARIGELTTQIFHLEIQVRRLQNKLDDHSPRKDMLEIGPIA